MLAKEERCCCQLKADRRWKPWAAATGVISSWRYPVRFVEFLPSLCAVFSAAWDLGGGHAAVAQAMEPASALDEVAALHMSIGRGRWVDTFDVLDISAWDV